MIQFVFLDTYVVRRVFPLVLLPAWLLCSPMPPPPPLRTLPIDRLMRNTIARLRQNPGDAASYYLLGRLHSYSFTDATVVPENRDLRYVGPVRDSGASLPPGAKDHFVESLRNYQKAVDLKPEQPVYHFSLGWMNEQGARFSKDLGLPPLTGRMRLSGSIVRRTMLAGARFLTRLALSLTYLGASSSRSR